MGYELPATTRGYDLAQIERDWTMAQARIDTLAEAGARAIQRLLQDALEREATPDQRGVCKPCRTPAVTTPVTWGKPLDPPGLALSHISSPHLV